ncbi:hypothetical protein EGW08_022272 [Elysia chlorotica]|uniref:Uncharacterized protein n=1 Tax=Elysia chlorotica TaxID=188477 RepID=A0A433SLE4_ELYCH|nr:hypothetical protein EGW08_022272 [Elysia chlorotica]
MRLPSLQSLTSVRWKNYLLLCAVSLLLAPLVRVSAFNIGTSGARVIRGNADTLFGTTLHFLPETSKLKSPGELMLLVSAPKENTTTTTGNKALGAVHTCTDIFKPSPSCSPFHDRADLNIRNAERRELFGFAVAVNDDGSSIICSPHFTDTNPRSAYFSIGRCSVVNESTPNTGHEYTPFYNAQDQWRRYVGVVNVSPTVKKTAYFEGLASYGFSVDSKMGDFFVAGAPGVMEGEGTVVYTDFDNNLIKFNVPFKYNLNTTAYGYLGYDVKIGQFCDNSEICFAASSPNLNRIGAVQIFKKVNKEGSDDLERIQFIQGSQAWAYFGYSLAACDVNNDGWDELLVGTPHFTDVDNANGQDQGRVFVYSRTDSNQDLQHHITLEGSRSQFGRFGSTVQCLGDINLDGYMDVAVGAPSEDNGAGNVHIYLGSSSGLSNPSNQRITASSLPVPLNGIGYAVSRSHTIPGSKYPIIAISSVAEDTVVVLSTRPIVDANVTLVATPNLIDLNEVCSDDDIEGPCFTVELCLSGDVRGGGSWDNRFNINLAIDTNVKTTGRKRALFRMSNGSYQESVEMMFDATRKRCVQYTAAVITAQGNRDRFSPVTINVDFSLASTTDDNTTPVLDAIAPQSKSTTVTFKNDCGDNNICDVDLSITGKLDYFGHKSGWTSIVVDGTKELFVELSIKNSQETNYWTVVEIAVNLDLPFSRPTPSTDPSITCQAVTQDTDETGTMPVQESKVICNYYKPLKNGETVKVGVAFDTFEISLEKKTLTVTAKVMPKNLETSKEIVPSDNTLELYTNVQIIADVTVNGVSSPAEMTVQDVKPISLDGKTNILDAYKPKDVEDLSLTHKFLVRNKGPSTLLPTKVRMSIPFYLTDASQFVNSFTVEMTSDSGDVSVCKSIKNFDSFGRVIQATTGSPIRTTKKTVEDKTTTDATMTTTLEVKKTTNDYWFPGAEPRRRRSTLSRNRRSAAALNSNIYIQSCKLDPVYCQVFECDLSHGLKRDHYAEVNVSLVVNKLNIPVPQSFNTFWYEVRAEVIQPKHELMDDWQEEEGTGNSVTKFHLVESGGKINIWIIIGSIIGGLILITIVVIILWRAGFFKRNKHQQVAQWKRESQRRSRYSSVPQSDGGPQKE